MDVRLMDVRKITKADHRLSWLTVDEAREELEVGKHAPGTVDRYLDLNRAFVLETDEATYEFGSGRAK